MQSASYVRIDSLDLIRGIAILGILVMNVYSMAAPPIAYSVPLWRWDGTVADTAVYLLQSLAVESRFMSIFSMLFGVGLMLQSDRMRARGIDPRPRLRRRLAWLLLFGMIHGFLLWHGDILTLYALSGFLVLRATEWSPRRLTIVGVILIAVGQLALLSAFAGSLFTGANIMEVPPLPFDAAAVEAARTTWTTLPARVAANAAEYTGLIAIAPFMLIWHAAGVMMLGMALYRRGFFETRSSWRRGLVSLAVGAILGGAVTWLRYAVGLETSAGQSLLGVMMIAGILMAIGYMSLMVPLATGRFRESAVGRALHNTGKTAFTLYISQTVITLLIFVVILRAQWGSWTRPQLLLYVAVFSVLQVVYAHWQQTRRGQGPLEKLWRRLAYGKPAA